MNTVSLSTRLSLDEVAAIDDMAVRSGLERSAFLKLLIRKGMSEVTFKHAVESYRSGTVTLSKAASIAGISYRDFLIRMDSVSLELNYDVDEFNRDLDQI